MTYLTFVFFKKGGLRDKIDAELKKQRLIHEQEMEKLKNDIETRHLKEMEKIMIK